MIRRLWGWFKARVVMLKPEKAPQTDVKGGAIGFRFWFK